MFEKIREMRRNLSAKLSGTKKGAMGWYGLIMGAAMAVLGLVVFGLIAVIGVMLLGTMQTTAGTGATAAVNGTIANATSGIGAVVGQLPLIGLVIAFAVILVIVIGAVVAVVGGRGRE